MYVCVCCLFLSPLSKVKLACEKLGGVFVREWSERVTHVVMSTNAGIAKRTVKYVAGVVSGECFSLSSLSLSFSFLFPFSHRHI